MMAPEPTTLTGTVARVIYEGADGPFTVFELATDPGTRVTVTAPAGGLASGLGVRLTGDYQDHPRFGRRFRANTVLILPPERPESIAAYLASGQVDGVGPRLAARIVGHFGPDVREVLDSKPERLTEVPGIGPARAGAVSEAWRRQVAQRERMLLLCDLGLTPTQATRAVRAYGDEAPARVAANPYDLARDVSGIGFRTADAIAGRLGIAPDSPLRIGAASRHVLATAADMGHLFLPVASFLAEVASVTGQDASVVQPVVDLMAAEGRITIEDDPFEPRVFETSLRDAERRVASRILTLAAVAVRPLPLGSTRAGGLTLAPSQLEALAVVAGAPVAVLTGGPGTGKTTIVGSLLDLADRAGLRVMLAAPTGRAAMRMKETSGRDARTVHRLLEFNPRDGGFQRNESRPLETDWVVVDESSMLDVSLADRLLRALSPGTRLTLVGDADQLPPVGPGDPFRDLVRSGAVPVARLREVFRQGEGSAIVHNAHRILAGDEPITARAQESTPGDFHVAVREDPAALAELVVTLVAERIPARFGLDPRTDVQVLAPMRRGDCGTDALNRMLRERLNPASAGRPGPAPGDRVIQNRNNYDRDIYNGDIGTVLSVAPDGCPTVRFDDRDVVLEGSEADDLAPAYAITVHKSQGSEFPAVIAVLHTQHFVMLRRNLLYTAVTRGRRLVVLAGNRRAIRLALDNARLEPRNTRLAERLQGAD
jgi:exodeoxyribonuclease V alpha subunit